MNYAQYPFDVGSEGNILIEGEPLIFHHFHRFECLENGDYYRFSNFFTSECKEPTAGYERYESALARVLGTLRKIEPGFTYDFNPVPKTGLSRMLKSLVPAAIKQYLRSRIH